MDGVRNDAEKDLLPAPAPANLPQKDIELAVAQTQQLSSSVAQ